MDPLRLLVLALCCAAALVTAPSAFAQQKMTLAVEVTGIHHVDWEYVSEDFPTDCAHWGKGKGEQTLGFSTPRPMRVNALVHSGKRLKGMPKGLPKVQLFAVGQGRWRSTVTREGDIDSHVPGSSCQACGGELGACDGSAPSAPPKPASDCGRKTPRTPVANLAYLPRGTELPSHAGEEPLAFPFDIVQADVTTVVQDLYKTCAPAVPAPYRNEIQQPNPLAVHFSGAGVNRLAKLRVGGTVTLKAHTERGYFKALNEKSQLNCEMERPSFGYYECSVTDITLEVRRLK